MQLENFRLLRQEDYKLSRFVSITVIQHRGKDVLLLHQNMYGGFIAIELEGWNVFAQNPSSDQALLAGLIKDKFVVPKKLDEAAEYRCRHQELVHRFSLMRSHSVMTRQCNLGCLYCILDHEPDKMNRTTAMQVDRFWTKMIKQRKPARVRDVYSGGEVMLCPDVILESAGRRFYFCDALGTDWAFSIISNGYLITPAVVSRMKEVGLESVRISMAGPAEIHNRLRPLKTGADTYETIMRNMEAISGLTSIFVECQFDAGSDDYIRVPEMLADFRKRGIEVENVHFTPILPKQGRSEFRCGVGDPEKLLFLMHEAEKFGFKQFNKAPSNGCMTDYLANMVFDTDGKFLRCPSTQKEFIYGDAAQGIDSSARSQLLERQYLDKCLKSCELLPLCNGGCRLNSLSTGGSFCGVDCQYDSLRAMHMEYLRQKAVPALEADLEKMAA